MTTDYTASPPPRRPRSLAALWTTIIALFATSIFGLAAVADDDTADSPRQAVLRLLRAANQSDVLGALDAIVPSERTILRQPVVDTVKEAERLGILKTGTNLERFDGLTVRFDDVRTTTEAMAPDMAAVRITGGRVASAADPSRFAGPIFDELGVDVGRADGTVDEIGGDSPEPIVTRRVGGRWYVSIAYSIAESARLSLEIERTAPFGEGIAARGEGSPEKAVDVALRAAMAADVERVIALVSAGEGDALRDYAPLFLGEDRPAALATVRALTLAVVSNADGVARVAIKTFDIEIDPTGDRVRITFDGTCTTVRIPGEQPERSCADDVLDALPILGALPSGSNQLTVTALEENGAWFVSPTRTITDLILQASKLLDQKTLVETIRALEDEFAAA